MCSAAHHQPLAEPGANMENEGSFTGGRNRTSGCISCYVKGALRGRGMSWLLTLIELAILVGCTGAPRSASQVITAPDTTAVTRKLQNAWHRCLEQSYRTTRTQTPDKNAAAEMAFHACSSEEQDLASLPYSAMLMPHEKAETKHVLIEEGRLPIYPEQ